MRKENGAAAGFEVVIGAPHSFTVSGPAAGSEARRTRTYRLAGHGHSDYLDLLAALARDFGTRAPHGRQPEPAEGGAPLQPLLTRTVSPEILFGYGDPCVLRVGAGYALVATSNDAPQVFPILRSNDLLDWRLESFAFPDGRGPGWAAPIGEGGEYWAPELHRLGGRYILCFAAREADHRFSIGFATSDAPTGPFQPAAAPVLRGNVIDPHILVEGDRAWLFWKEDRNDLWPGRLCHLLHADAELAPALFPHEADRRTAAFARALWPWVGALPPMERFFVLQALIEAVTADFTAIRARLAAWPATAELARLLRTPIHAQRLDPERLALLGESSLVLENDQDWEGHLVEGVWVTPQAGRYHMLYAGNDFSTAQYGIGVAVADAPLGPYRKRDTPLLRSTAAWSGPGHPSVAEGPDGGPWMFLHGFFPGQAGYKAFRALLGTPITFGAAGIKLRR